MAPVGPRKPPERKTDQGAQAPYRHRHGWIVGRPCHSRGRHSGSGRSARIAGPLARTYPLLRVRPALSDGSRSGSHLRRRRLGWAKTARGDREDRALDPSDRQAFGHCRWLRTDPAQMGGRAHLRLARTLSPHGERLGENHRQRRTLAAHRPHRPRHPNARKAMTSFEEFRIGL